jgi:hypothetical protein
MTIPDFTIMPFAVRNNHAFLSEYILSITNYPNEILFFMQHLMGLLHDCFQLYFCIS